MTGELSPLKKDIFARYAGFDVYHAVCYVRNLDFTSSWKSRQRNTNLKKKKKN